MRISKGGQISIPATIRHRWNASTLALTDEGERIILEPAADDPVAAADGALAGEHANLDQAELRRAARADDSAAATRRSRG